MSNKVTTHTITHRGESFDLALYRGRRKSLRLRVCEDGRVEALAPLKASTAWVLEFAQAKAAWVLKKRAELAGRVMLPWPEKFASGEAFSFLGRNITLSVLLGRGRPELLGDLLLVRVSQAGGGPAVERALEAWLKEQAAEVLNAALQRCLVHPLLAGLPRPALRIRKMKSRWGSCSNKGDINLNLQLVRLPPALLEYVVWHELAHLKHHDHSPAFYAFLSQLLPGWQQCKARLADIRMPQ